MGSLAITKAETDFNWIANQLDVASKSKRWILNPLDVGFSWAKNIKGSQCATEKVLHGAVSGIKEALAIPSFIVETNYLVNDLMEGIRSKNTKEKAIAFSCAVGDLGDMGQSVADVASGLARIKAIKIPDAANTALNGLSNVGLFVSCASGIAKSSVEISDTAKKIEAKNLPSKTLVHEKQKINRSTLSLACSISYLALAIIGLVSMIFSSISPFIGLSMFTLGVAFSLSKTIYEKAVNYQDKP